MMLRFKSIKSNLFFSFFFLCLHLGEGHIRFDRLHLEPYHNTVWAGFSFDESSRATARFIIFKATSSSTYLFVALEPCLLKCM